MASDVGGDHECGSWRRRGCSIQDARGGGGGDGEGGERSAGRAWAGF